MTRESAVGWAVRSNAVFRAGTQSPDAAWCLKSLKSFTDLNNCDYNFKAFTQKLLLSGVHLREMTSSCLHLVWALPPSAPNLTQKGREEGSEATVWEQGDLLAGCHDVLASAWHAGCWPEGRVDGVDRPRGPKGNWGPGSASLGRKRSLLTACVVKGDKREF